MGLLAAVESPNTEPMDEIAELLEEVMEDGAWGGGQAWAEGLLGAVAASCVYADVAEDVYGGQRITIWEDEEGPLGDGWYDEPYSLLEPVLEALKVAGDPLPPRWGEVLLAVAGRFEECGLPDFDVLVEACEVGRGVPEYPKVLELVSKLASDHPDQMIDMDELPSVA